MRYDTMRSLEDDERPLSMSELLDQFTMPETVAPTEGRLGTSVPPDNNPLCKAWARAGECQLNPRFMEVQCATSCSSPIKSPWGLRCPNVQNFIYDGTKCDPGYWCGCADPSGNLCEPSNGTLTAWVGQYTQKAIGGSKVYVGLSPYFPEEYFKCNDTLYCPGSSNPQFCPQLCNASSYCPNATTQLDCPEGHYCLMGSTEPTKCNSLHTCPEKSVLYHNNLESGLVMLVAAVCFLLLNIANRMLKDVEAIEDNEDNCQTYKSVRVNISNRPSLANTRTYSTMKIQGPSQKIDMSFRDLQLTLPNGLCIMEGVSGQINHGSFCAILGPSGAGKTTFLSLISGKNDPTGGQLLVNGEEGTTLAQYRRLVGFVPQEDIMLRELTVYENIRHAAMMRLPASMSKKKKLKRVQHVMESLDLMHIKHTVVGDELKRGISGGQRKRVNVAMELVMDPALICLDEPTSGLDSTSSAMLCESLVALARLGVNVSAVLHQPKTEIFDMFDTVLLLGVGGRTVYLGPAAEMVDYFARIGFPLPPRTNPCDYVMDVVAGVVPCEDRPAFLKEELFELWETAPENPDNCIPESDDPPTRQSLKQEQPLSESVLNRGMRLAATVATQKDHWFSLAKHVFDVGNSDVRQVPGFFGQTSFLYRRAVLQRVRVPANTFWPLLLSVFAGAITGGVANALGTTPFNSLQPIYFGVSYPRLDPDKASFFFLENWPIPPSNNVVQLWQITGLVILLVSVQGINVFGKERAVFFRDASGGTLVSAYWTAKTFEVFLWLPLFSALFSATNYLIQPLVMNMVDYWLIAWMSFIGFYGIGGCGSILVGLENRGIVTLVTGLLCLLLFTGFLFPFNDKWYFKPFFTFWVAQAFNERMYDVYDEVFDTRGLNKGGAGYNLDTTFQFNVGMAFVTGFAWHLMTLVLLKCVDFRKQR
ncbi:Putative white-brown complex homolog protein 30 [Seminavis robusta]|uniref:White-brown complex homolog protein 30 n=1 Tax=Seminavis robusta TaxID=568900 RepID=A0A9N8DMD5_9STRA|nr:Putative white-brown complex homolog protein 30 [Seminavis robusta]|eukprot:Sro223_g091300.1 Putative white-brown complex homolog protein 30 (929) ;mRNA; f:12800-16159